MSVRDAPCSRERRLPPGERERRCAGSHVADVAQLVGGGHRGAGGARRHQPQVGRKDTVEDISDPMVYPQIIYFQFF